MDLLRALGWCRRASAIGAALVLVGGLGVAGAAAAKKAKKPASTPSYYTLKNTKQRCRVNYTRQRITITVRKRHRKVTVHQVRCVYTGAATANGKTVSFPTSLPTAAITVTVIPSAGDASFSIAANKILDVSGSGVLSGQSAAGLSVTLVTGPAHGKLTLNHNGTFRYTPSGSFSGVDSFTYRTVSSSGESSTPATVTIHVTPVAAAVGVYDVPLNGTLSVSAPGVLTGDSGSGLTAQLVSPPSGGSLKLNPDGSFTYVAIPPFSGADTFTFQAVDASGQASHAVTVTLEVGAGPPLVSSETFSGEIGNTELQVGGSRGSGPEVYQAAASALDNDIDPSGGTLTTTPGTITTVQGGQVTLATDGSFSYEPPPGLANATDSFAYQVDSSDGLSAQASATIDISDARVWYVNSSGAPGGGTGTSVSPFQSLSAVNAPGGAAAPGDSIFLFSSGSAYAGGAVLGTQEALVGEPAGLTVDNEQLLGASNSAAPQITNSGGVGVALADGDSLNGVTISNAGGDGVSMGSGSFSIDDVAVTGAHADGIDVQSAGTGNSGFYIANSQISGGHGSAISLSYAGNASGNLVGNTIGTGDAQAGTWTAGSGSTAGDGIDLTSTGGSASVFANVYGNDVFGIASGTGMLDRTTAGGALQLILGKNFVGTDAGAGNAVTVTAGSDGASGTVCVDPDQQNTLTALGGAAHGIEMDQGDASLAFGIQGLSAGSNNAGAVETFLTGITAFGTGGGGAYATPSNGNFVNCTVEQPTS